MGIGQTVSGDDVAFINQFVNEFDSLVCTPRDKINFIKSEKSSLIKLADLETADSSAGGQFRLYHIGENKFVINPGYWTSDGMRQLPEPNYVLWEIDGKLCDPVDREKCVFELDPSLKYQFFVERNCPGSIYSAVGKYVASWDEPMGSGYNAGISYDVTVFDDKLGVFAVNGLSLTVPFIKSRSLLQYPIAKVSYQDGDWVIQQQHVGNIVYYQGHFAQVISTITPNPFFNIPELIRPSNP